MQALRRIVPASVRPYLGDVRRRMIANPARIARQKLQLLDEPGLNSSGGRCGKLVTCERFTFARGAGRNIRMCMDCRSQCKTDN
jgi:hypothetical protein